MTVKELFAELCKLDVNQGDLDITIRCSWDGDGPNGNCFQISGVCVDNDHSTEQEFLAIDCDQDFDS